MINEFIKVAFIHGLADIVTDELNEKLSLSPLIVRENSIYLESSVDLDELLKLKSITNIYLAKQADNLHPAYLANHKSILMDLIEKVLDRNKNTIKTYHLSCAGDDSAEVLSIKSYIESQYKLIPDSENPDLKLFIGKNVTTWEISVEATIRPLSQRDYKVTHIKGGINPTAAYAINSLCELESKSSYLNICSGSATLLIEAAHINPNLRLVGFDNSKEHISLAIQNLRAAKLLRFIELKYLDLLDHPDIGTFDVITSDLPFGMHIGKDTDLSKLYQEFVKYCEKALNSNGILAIYTTETTTIESALEQSRFDIIQEITLKIITNVNSYIYPKILICKFKTN